MVGRVSAFHILRCNPARFLVSYRHTCYGNFGGQVNLNQSIRVVERGLLQLVKQAQPEPT